MTQIDPNRAWALLKDVAIRVPPVSCASAMVDDPSGFYDTLGTVLPVIWTRTKTPEVQRYLFLEQRLEEISSPVQLAPMERLLARLDAMNPKPLALSVSNQLEDTFASVLSRTSGSDRELSEAENIIESIKMFLGSSDIDTLRARLLLSSLSDFLKANFKEPRCADRLQNRERAVESFNSLVAKYFSDQSVQPLDPRIVETSQRGDGPHTELIPEFTDVIPVDLLRSLDAYQRVSIVAPQQQGEETRTSVEDDMNHALRLADTIETPPNGCRACTFEEKRQAIFLLYDRAPSEGTRARALDALVKLLASDEIQEQSKIEWLWQVHFLLNLARTPSKEQVALIEHFTAGKESFSPFLPKPGDGDLILGTIVRSGNPILMQYVNAERILKNNYILPPYISASSGGASAKN